MARRIRTIKPEILDSESTALLSDAAFRLLIGMITLADDYGSLGAHEDWLASQVFWNRNRTPVHELLIELEAAEHIQAYRVRGKTYIHLVKFREHQKIDRPSKNKVPKFEEAEEVIRYAADPREGSRDSREGSSLEGKGREGKGEEYIPDSAPPPRGEIAVDESALLRAEGTKPTLGLKFDPPVSRGSKFDFEAIYANYPRKLGKKRGLQLCASRVKTAEQYSALERAVTNYARTVAGSDVQYVKHFDTFMGCWEDYVDYQPPRPKGGLRDSVVGYAAETRDATEEYT